MRGMQFILLAVLVAGYPARAATPSEDPDLPVRFFNAIPDICFQTARGHPPTAENAASLLLEPTSDVPQTVKAHFDHVTSWFRLKSNPNQIFIGTGDRPNACHVVLANSKQTQEVQKKVVEILKIGGFQLLQAPAASSPYTDMLFVKEAPDGYMLISLQAPRTVLRDGEGDQGAVHVNLMPKAMFEAMVRH